MKCNSMCVSVVYTQSPDEFTEDIYLEASFGWEEKELKHAKLDISSMERDITMKWIKNSFNNNLSAAYTYLPDEFTEVDIYLEKYLG